ncbi:hypothetical protein CANINC_001101 [Pichia inconspicua]|uniref:C2 NT-type domain-containing protein n=1 Tax=Pichia inconspicua TaxID=52247 RepID=A0A4T0X652_9ASCO|nr:hypothetical protein CANINC_001101 [[Candida] inconspicua]
MGKAEFRVEATVRELVNVPLFDGAEVYIVWTISGSPLSGEKIHHSHLSTILNGTVPVRNHRASFQMHGEISGTFKVQTKVGGGGGGGGDGDGSENVEAEDKWLCIQFLLKRKSKGKVKGKNGSGDELLGVVNLNLVEFMNEKDRKELRLLLEDSKTNCIAKMSVWVKCIDGSSSIKYHTSARSRGSTTVVGSTLDEGILGSKKNVVRATTTTSTNSVPLPKAVSTRTASTGNDEMEVSADTQTMMIRACEEALQDTSIMNELLNNTYRFTWQLKTHRYKEFSPTECVRDIVERNGNGWKKNDEGMNMIDVVVADEIERLHIGKHGFIDSESDEEWEIARNEAGVFDEFNGESSSDEGDNEDSNFEAVEDELRRIYYRSNKKNKVNRLRPLSEADVREDLRSWHVNV